MKTRFSHAATFGLAAGIVAVALSLLIYLLVSPMSAWNYLSYAGAITVACFGVRHWRIQNGGFLSYGQAYVHLLLQTIVYAVIASFWAYVFFAFIAPDAIASIQLMQEIQFEEQGVPQAQIDMTMEMMRQWQTPPIMAISSLVVNIFIIGLVHLIVAAIMKKDPPPPAFIPPTDFSNTPFPPQPNQPHGNSPFQQPPSNLPPQP